jgi:acetolactate synthase-1/2/3 large subunit
VLVTHDFSNSLNKEKCYREAMRAPRVQSRQKPDGSMVSRPLEDMYPFLPREEFLANMTAKPLEE